MKQVLQNLLLLFFVSSLATVKAEAKQCSPSHGHSDPDAQDYGDLECSVEDSGDLIYENTIEPPVGTTRVTVLLYLIGYRANHVSSVNIGKQHGKTELIQIWNDAVTASIANPDPTGQFKVSFQVYGTPINEGAVIYPQIIYV